MTKANRLAELQEQYAKCLKCPLLVQNRMQVVFGAGNPETCKIVIIGEAPGKKEDELGQPFVGKSGQLLDTFLANINLKRPDDVYITNTILCRPPHNRNPNKEELNSCRHRLDKHIEILDPKVIITLGNFATQYLLQTKEGITKIRGKPIKTVILGKKRIIVPMQHPAVLLYNGNSPAKRAEFVHDFGIVQNILTK